MAMHNTHAYINQEENFKSVISATALRHRKGRANSTQNKQKKGGKDTSRNNWYRKESVKPEAGSLSLIK